MGVRVRLWEGVVVFVPWFLARWKILNRYLQIQKTIDEPACLGLKAERVIFLLHRASRGGQVWIGCPPGKPLNPPYSPNSRP